MKKIIVLFRKYVAYSIIELFLFVSLIHLIFRDLFLLYEIRLNPIYISAPILIIFLLRKKNIMDLKEFLNRFESMIDSDISLVNLFFLSDVDKRFGYSTELIEKEKQRVLDRIKEIDLKIHYRNIIILFIITFFTYLSLFPLSVFYGEKGSIMSFDVFPKDSKVFFGSNIELYTDYKGNKPVDLFIKRDGDVIQKFRTKKKLLKIDSDILYSFSVDKRKSDTYEINVIMPLRLEKSVFRVDYPDYTGLSSVEMFDSNFSVLEVSDINCLFMFNHEIKNLRIDTIKGNIKLEGNMIKFMAVEDTVFKIKAEDIYGQIFESDIFRIRIKKDQVPQIKILTPEERNISIKNGKIEIRAMISDDYGLLDSTLVVIEKWQDTREIKLADYKDNITEVIQNYQLKVASSGSFYITASDNFSQGTSEIIYFTFIDRFAKVKSLIENTNQSVEDIQRLMEQRKKTIEGKKEAIENMMYKDKISKADENLLSKTVDDFQDMYKQGKKLEDKLKTLQEIAEKENMSRDIIDNLKKIREELNHFLQDSLINTTESFSKMIKEKKVKYEEYKKLSSSIDLEKTKKELERTLDLIKKAREEAEQQAIVDYIDMIIKSQQANIVQSQKNIKTKEYSVLKGLKINQDQIINDFTEIAEHINPDTSKILSEMESAKVLIFKDIQASIVIQISIVEDLLKIKDDMQNKINKKKEKEKQEIKNKLQALFKINLDTLKDLNKLDKNLKGGLSPRDAGKDFMKIKDSVSIGLGIFEEIVRDSFILESAYYRNFNETISFMERAYKVGKEIGRGVDSYMYMSQRHMMNIGIEVAKALHKIDSMDSATAMSELMERIERLQKMQQGMGQEMMELLSGHGMSDRLMEYYASMQNRIRKEIEGMMGNQFSDQLD
ncbi:MAG: hypothetical protein C0601_00590 [Candidatus Muiribacterium halophilum]|uniref:DUF4175 domain-containing protein n=1 Tax=Muiribacterium halophilum TaxID=2053465 RepID=A0A2N5ZMN9_MUIH1|nr:MAG: hypothetical protein C0601_00590 [Candidatus Muirbacterium halophilum]